MSDEDNRNPIDFSALDPGRNQIRWERLIQKVAAEAHAEQRRRMALQEQLLRWARPVLAVAAALCLLVWTAGYVVSPRPATTTAQSPSQPPAFALASWVANDRIPESSELLSTLGGNP